MANEREIDNEPRITIISGFDPSGGAGFSIDASVVSSYGISFSGAITAIANQTHEKGISVFPVASGTLRGSLDSAFSINPTAVKIGMLADARTVEIVAEFLEKSDCQKIVLDPVMKSSSGMILLDKKGIESMVENILPFVIIYTPNFHEASFLSGTTVNDLLSAEKSASHLFEKFGKAVLIKGGHNFGDPIDIFCDGEGIKKIISKRVSGDFRGTGCFLSSAICAELALGAGLFDAVSNAKRFLFNSLENSTPPYIKPKR